MSDSELLDKALEILENMGFDIPCDEMFGCEYCKNCEYDHPKKECWKKYLSK